jgi:hypothetical protein
MNPSNEISKRDWFAGLVLQSLIGQYSAKGDELRYVANGSSPCSDQHWPKIAYEIADLMVLESEKLPTPMDLVEKEDLSAHVNWTEAVGSVANV